jgi:Na+-driven multidrug efflux pump
MGLSAVLDVALNPVFILGLGPAPALGIEGSAVATVIAGLVGLAGMVAYIYAKDLPIRLRGHEWRYLVCDRALLGRIVRLGIPMGLQMIVVSTSALAMIGLVNRQGTETTAAYGAANQLWTYIQMPAMAIGAAVSAMAAQNIGAGRWDRVRAITNGGLIYNLLMTGAALFAFWLFDEAVLGLFMGPESPAIPIAVHIQTVAGWSFIFSGMTLVLFGTARANGAVLGPLLCMIAAILVGRLSFAVAAQPWLGFDALWWAFPFGSVLNYLLAWIYYVNGSWKKGVLVDRAERAEHPEMASA